MALYMDTEYRDGNLYDYWEKACGIELKGFDGEQGANFGGGVYPRTEGWNIYYKQGHHGQSIYLVVADVVASHTEEAVALLGAPITQSKNRRCDQGGSFCENELKKKNKKRENCAALLADNRNDGKAFFESLSGRTVDVWGRTDAQELNLITRHFELRWKMHRWNWLTALFELVFLSAWWIFTSIPWLIQLSRTKQLCFLVFSPLVLMLPYYFGYATFLFSTAPSGAYIYDVIVTLLTVPVIWIPPNAVDVSILEAMPNLLGFIGKMPGPAMAMSSRGFVGPTACLLYGLALVLAVMMATAIKPGVKRLFAGKK